VEKKNFIENYTHNESKKNIELTDRISTYEDFLKLTLSELYPEFNIQKNDVVGYFNPYISGSVEAYTFGFGSNILSLLPFFKKIIVKIQRVPQNLFRNFYGIEFSDLITLVDAGIILPLLPVNLFSQSYWGKEPLNYLTPLFKKQWPSNDRVFRITQMTCIKNIEEIEGYPGNIQRYIVNYAKKIFNNDSTAIFNFLTLCTRAIYRGDPLLVVYWMNKLENFIEELRPAFKKEQNLFGFILSLLDLHDDIFSTELYAPGANSFYSGIGFDFLIDYHKSRKEYIDNHSLTKNLERFNEIDERLSQVTKTISIEECAILKENFIYEPIKAVGNINKFIHWLEHSENVQENQKIISDFNHNLSTRNFAKAYLSDIEVIREIIKEINREISYINFDFKASRILLQVGASIGGALAGSALDQALQLGDIKSLFAICGAVAMTALASETTDVLTQKIGSKVYQNNYAFLLWRKIQKKE